MSINRVPFLGTGADDVALALKMYTGWFNEAWREATYLWHSTSRVIKRKNVTAGKSHQFLQLADLPDAEDYTPGDELVGQGYAVDEGIITPDRYLVAHQFVPRDQMQIAHFDILKELATAQASKIGRMYDKRLFITAAKQARELGVTKNGLTVHNGGNRVTRGGGSVAAAYAESTAGAANFRADVRKLARLQDEDNVPELDREIWYTPYMRGVLGFDNTAQVFSTDYVNRDQNSQQERKVKLLEGYKVMGHPNKSSGGGAMPDENFVSGQTKFQGNFTPQASDGTPVALALSAGPEGQAAVGVVTYENVQNVVQYYPEKMSWLVMSFLFCGVGGLHPYCAGSVEVTN